MRRLGKALMGVGAGVGTIVGVAALAHTGLAGVPWVVNVALAKLGLVASGGLMAGGAMILRLSRRRDQAALPRDPA
jgi:hypothetical protein